MKIRLKEVEIKVDDILLKGNLGIPKDAKGIVVFVHGSGSSRFSPRNQFVAEQLYKSGFATLLMDLLTEEEEAIDMQTAELRFDITLLVERILGATNWLKKNQDTKSFNVAYFGSSTGAAAALIASTKFPSIKAIVSRGGRPDLAIMYLPKVKAPTLLIVGGDDFPVIEMNKEALKKLRAEKKLEIIPRATHLFEEPGTLQKVAELAASWFLKYMGKEK